MSDLSRARKWRERAEELRAIAEAMRDGAPKENLLALSDDLDRMAERLERRQTS